MQQPIMPLAFIVQRFWSMAADILSSHIHMTFMPLAIFSIFMVQRGTIMPDIAFMDIEGTGIEPIMGAFMPVVGAFIIIPRSVVIALVIAFPCLNFG